MKFINLENNLKSRPHQSIIKESNIKQIFDLVFENEGISRIEISRITNLSRSTVSLLMEELMDAGLIRMIGERASDSSGRKPIGLEINGDRAQIITLSLRKDHYHYILYDIRGRELEQFSHRIVYKNGCAAKIWNMLKSRSSCLDESRLLVVCVSIPAKINKTEKSINLSILDTDKNFDLLKELKSMCPQIPLVAVNQSSARAYAEYKYVYGGKNGDLIYFNIDDGVGAGIMVNGRLFTGEIGHMSIDPKGPRCVCGKQGCLENQISKTAVIKEFTARAGGDQNGVLYALIGGDPVRINYRLIREALEQGDLAVMAAARDIAEKIALGISNVICMFDPEKIVVGGNILELGRTFLNMVLARVEIPGINGVCTDISSQIVGSGIAHDAENLGVLRFFLDRIFTISVETVNTIYLGD
ncbi:ROK family transcriptional regulator [Treponema sp. TIM-1]|uniref:ROK family transcriptional regulator n=1 Tax=Treponema sp. TIM-1 TaxID=2898417 RepID=UPI003980F43D